MITGMPNNMTGSGLVEFWIDKASSANKGVDRPTAITTAS